MAVDVVGGNVGIPQSWNRYVYARNNPLRLVDPDGQLAVDAALAKQFPKSAAFILSLRPDTADFNAYRQVLGIEGLSLDVKAKFVPGSGPAVHMKSFHSPYQLGETPTENHIDLTWQMLEAFEKGVPGSAKALEALVKHEVAHSLDWADGRLHDPNGPEGETGDEWEYARHGEKVSDDLFNPPRSGTHRKDTSGFDELRALMESADARIGAVTQAEQSKLSEGFRNGWQK